MLPKRLTRHWNHSSVAFLTPADQSAPPQPHHRQGDTQSRQDQFGFRFAKISWYRPSERMGSQIGSRKKEYSALR